MAYDADDRTQLPPKGSGGNQVYKIGIDVGGTFTDFVVAGDDGQPRFFKTAIHP